MNDIIRRKVARRVAAGGEGGPGADHGWRLAFARAARDAAGLLVEVEAMALHRRSLAELLELPPERALLALLDGPQGGLGLVAMSAEVMQALIEMQTTGRVSAAPILPRRPTRIDAAMVAGVIDRALAELEAILAEEADFAWAGGFRYASFLEDPRPLGLLLEDQPYRVLSAQLSLAGGGRTGGLLLALPAEGRGQPPLPRGPHPDSLPGPAAPGFAAELGAAVMAADCTLDAVIARVSRPLCEVMALQPGQVLALGQAALDRISLEGIGGRPLAQARLGQQKGMRALRLKEGGSPAGMVRAGGGPEPAAVAAPAMPEPVPADEPRASAAPGRGAGGAHDGGGLLATG